MLNLLRQMMDEEPEPVVAEQKATEEIAEDTPHFLNPKVLNAQDAEIAYDAEEAGEPDNGGGAENVFADQPPEKMEEVRNTGMSFISGLLEMANGINS